MTCVAGLKAGGRVYIGGDSAFFDHDSLMLSVLGDDKVFVVGQYVFGFAGSWRVQQLIQHAAALPKPNSREDLRRFMTTKFMDSIREISKIGGVLKTENTRESSHTDFLVGIRGRLFSVQGGDFAVFEEAAPYAAVGCGAAPALGAFFAQSKSMAPKERVLQALAAAERFNAGVRAPFRVVSA